MAYNEEGDFANGPYSAEMEATGKVRYVILARDGHVN